MRHVRLKQLQRATRRRRRAKLQSRESLAFGKRLAATGASRQKSMMQSGNAASAGVRLLARSETQRQLQPEQTNTRPPCTVRGGPFGGNVVEGIDDDGRLCSSTDAGSGVR